MNKRMKMISFMLGALILVFVALAAWALSGGIIRHNLKAVIKNQFTMPIAGLRESSLTVQDDWEELVAAQREHIEKSNQRHCTAQGLASLQNDWSKHGDVLQTVPGYHTKTQNIRVEQNAAGYVFSFDLVVFADAVEWARLPMQGKAQAADQRIHFFRLDDESRLALVNMGQRLIDDTNE